jgi:hypothetical protein
MLKSRRLTGHMAIMCPVTGECGPKFNALIETHASFNLLGPDRETLRYNALS